MDFKPTSDFSNTILYYLGVVLLTLSVLLLIPIIPAFILGENTMLVFLIASIISFVWGILLFRGFKKGTLTVGRGMVLGASAFALIALVGATPYFLLSQQVFGQAPGFHALLNSYFESMSGFTTTGLSVIPDLLTVPQSVLFWRALTQWIGGVGVVVLFLTVLVGPGMSASYLFRGEAHEEHLAPSTKHTVRFMLGIYATYTVLGVLVLYLLGVPLLSSIMHIFASVSTGGFSSVPGGIGSFASLWVQIAIIFFMTVGATSFILHYKFLSGRFGELRGFAKSHEMQVFLLLMTFFSAILIIYLSLIGDPSPIQHGVFQVFSATTTTGFANMDIIHTSDFFKTILITLMFIGGGAGSTSGGLKIIRFMILLKSIPWWIKKYLLPEHAIVPLKVGHRVYNEEEMNQVSRFFFIYVVILIVGAMIMTLYGYSFIDALFESVSAGATVGLSMGITSISAPVVVKIILMFEMLLGRLEILPVLVWLGATLGTRRWSRFYD